MKGSIDRVMECTTGQFDGAIAVIQPKESWVVSFVACGGGFADGRG
jgi:transcription elongation factor SPT4